MTTSPSVQRITRRSMVMALPLLAGSALAQGAWPSKPITLVVGFPPGGSTDFIGRLIGQKLSEALGQPVPVENRGGANGLLAANAVAGAPADGYTLLLTSMGLTTNPFLYTRSVRDPVKDFTAISTIATVPNVIVINPALPAKTLTELLALARSMPAPMTIATTGQAAPGHLASELLQRAANVRFEFIAYKGSGPALTDIIAGHVNGSLPTVVAALPHIKSGKLRAIAVTGTTRSGLLPDVPTIAEAGVKELAAGSGWYGLVAPAGLPAPVVDKLGAAIARIMKMPDVREKLIANGADPVGSTPAEMATFIAQDHRYWGQVIKAANIKPED